MCYICASRIGANDNQSINRKPTSCCPRRGAPCGVVARCIPFQLTLNMSVFILFAAVATSILPPCYVQAQNSGDVRLVSNSSISYQGRLEVYLNGEWGTICVNNTADVRAVADTACRQLRFTGAFAWGSVEEMGYPVASDETPTHVRTIDCPSTNDDGVCSQDYPVHILRCAINETRVESACSHENDIGIYCNAEYFTSNTYDSQVALYGVSKNDSSAVNVSKSSGVLGIFYFGASHPGLVCGVGLDQNVADTACRQLGYTNAIAFNNSLQTTKQTIWDTGLDCSSQSHSCLNSCFSKKPTNQTSCTNIVYVSCEFQLSLKDKETSGSPLLCDTADKCNSTPTLSPGDAVELIVIVVVVIAIVAAVAICAICIALIVCCLLPGCFLYSRRRGGYQVIKE